MARTRAALTDKEEKILIQAQLMGLTTENMVKIANRLRAIKQENEFIRERDNVMQGITYEVSKNKHGDPLLKATYEGRLHVAERVPDRNHRWRSKWRVTVSKPGTRMKERIFENIEFDYGDSRLTKRLLPERSEYLYLLCRRIKRGNFD